MFANRSNSLQKVFVALLAVAMAFGMLGWSAQSAQAATTCTLYHTVQRGETLYSIGLKYGKLWTTLADYNNLSNPRVIYAGQKLCVDWTDDSSSPKPVPGKIPTFRIVSVVRDQNVTIETSNFPANDEFRVLMGPMGTRGVNGIRVQKIESGKGGTFKATFSIPDALKGSGRIAIRLESPLTGYYAYNWFYNNTSGSGTGTGDDANQPPGYSGIPTFSISSVVRNGSVTIRTNNLPPGDTFQVLMGPMGTRGINGYYVTSFDSGSGGSQTWTFNIPAQLAGSYQIAIRIQSSLSGYYAYNWFYNNTTN